MFTPSWPRRLALTIALAATSFTAGAAGRADPGLRLPDHYEFAAMLDAAFRPDAAGSYPIRLDFDYPGAGRNTQATWQVDVISPRGQVVQRWLGEAPLTEGRGSVRLAWNGRGAQGQALAAGFYSVRLRAVPSISLPSEVNLPLAQRAARSFALGREELADQRMDIRLGDVAAPKMPAFHALPTSARTASKSGALGREAVAASSLPFTIYYGNLHSQTNHSDGGTPVASCGGAEVPQAGTYGPTDAYTMMQNQAGGDFLLTSEWDPLESTCRHASLSIL